MKVPPKKNNNSHTVSCVNMFQNVLQCNDNCSSLGNKSNSRTPKMMMMMMMIIIIIIITLFKCQ